MTAWPALAAATALAAGVLAGAGRGWAAPWLLAAAVGAVIPALLVRRSRRTMLATALVAIALAGAADAAWRARAADDRLLPRLARTGEFARVCGVVVERGPRSVTINARRATALHRPWSVHEPLRVASSGAARPVPLGTSVCASGTLRPPRPGRDEPPMLATRRVRIRGVGSPVRYAAGAVRDKYSSVARRALPKRQAGLLLGMTDGDTALLDDDTMSAFRTTGLAHLVAVSGSNVAVVLAAVAAAARAVVRRGRWLRALVALPPLVFFAFLTGLEASVLRAVVTAGLVLTVSASGRTPDALRLAGLAFMGLVLATPALLTSVGFQLSFAATIGLIVGSRPLAAVLLRPAVRDGREPGRLLVLAAEATATTFAAQIAVAPLLALHFGRLPALGGLANLLVAPLAPVVMVGGMVTLSLGSFFSGLARAPSTLRLLLDAILATARGFAAIPGSSVAAGPLIALALGAVVAAVLLRPGRARTGVVAFAILCAAASCGRGVASSQAACPDGELRAFDVGQGTAILLRSGGHAVLMDGGPADGNIVSQLARIHVRVLDVAVISHPHADHTEGLARVLGHVRTTELVGPPTMTWGMGRPLVAEARRRHVAVRELAAGAAIDAGPGIHIDVLGPPPGPAPPESADAINPLNLIVRARVGKLTVLFPGDIDAEGTTELLTSGGDPAAPILIAPHHGSANLDPAFVEAVHPRLTLVTVGAHNRYGHPTAFAMNVYRKYGPVMRTDRDGTVVVCAAAAGLEVTKSR